MNRYRLPFLFFIWCLEWLSLSAGKNNSIITGHWEKLEPSVETINYHYRVRASENCRFGVDVACSDTMNWYRYEVNVPPVLYDDLNNSIGVKICYKHYSEGILMTDSLKNATVYVNQSKGVDLSIKVVGSPGNFFVEFGGDKVVLATRISICDSASVFIRSFSDEKGISLRETIDYTAQPALKFADFESVDGLYEYLKKSNDVYEGIWTFYDRTTQPLRASSDGEYVLAMVRSDERYELVYLDDRDKVTTLWKPLAIKGYMKTCDIPGVFDVVWLDRSGHDVRSRVTGTIDGDILTLNFPYWKVALRFNRVKIK